MEIAPYLNFNGQCREAFTFYEKCLRGKILMMQTYADSPMKDHVAGDWQNRIMHVRMEVGAFALMGSDAPAEMHQKAQGLYVSIGAVSHDEGARIFRELAEGGVVTMPYDKTFWSPGFGMVTDRFGTPWMVNAVEANG